MLFRLVVPLMAVLVIIGGCKRKDPFISESQKNITEKFTNKKSIEKISVPSIVNKNIKFMTFDEALQAKQYYEKIGDMVLTLKCLKRMKETTTNLEEMAGILIEMGDLEMAGGNYENAQLYYQEFKILYPGNENIRHVLYQEMLAHLFNKLESTKDQTKTREIIALADQFLQEFSQDDEFYTKRVHAILQDCYIALIDHELYCIRFYLHKFSYTYQSPLLRVVMNRLEYIQKELLPLLIPYNKSLLEIDKALTAQLAELQEGQNSLEGETKNKEELLESAQESVAFVKATQEGEKVISHAAQQQHAVEKSRADVIRQAQVLEEMIEHLTNALHEPVQDKGMRDRF